MIILEEGMIFVKKEDKNSNEIIDNNYFETLFDSVCIIIGKDNISY